MIGIIKCSYNIAYNITISRIPFLKFVRILVGKHVKPLEKLSVNSLDIIDIEGVTDTFPYPCSYFSIINLSWQQN